MVKQGMLSVLSGTPQYMHFFPSSLLGNQGESDFKRDSSYSFKREYNYHGGGNTKNTKSPIYSLCIFS